MADRLADEPKSASSSGAGQRFAICAAIALAICSPKQI